MEIFERPRDYKGPNLDPTGMSFQPRAFANGVYALLARPWPRDNSGVIAGEKAALVVHAGINGSVAQRIQEIAAKLTDKPVRYLVNTNYHGDHTFGNYAFPDSVEIIAHRNTAESMTDLEYEKRIRSRNLYGNRAAIAGVTRWRKPDRVFDDRLDIDLGGRVVQLRHFGPGNTLGDTVVYLPQQRLAWTGNLIGNEKLLPMLLEVGPVPYMETLVRCYEELDVQTTAPGHGPLGGPVAFPRTVRYLSALVQDVAAAVRNGLTAEEAVDSVRLRPEFELPWWFPATRLRELMRQFHRLNVLFEYREMHARRESAMLMENT